MDIAEWLDGLGLGRYAPAFVENEVDWEILSKLTADDLREMGVVAVGHRRRLLAACRTGVQRSERRNAALHGLIRGPTGRTGLRA